METKLEEEKKSLKLEKGQLKRALQIFSYIKPYQLAFFAGLFFLILSSLIVMVFPGLAGEMANIADGNPQYEMDLKQIGWFLLILLIIQGVISYVRVRLFVHVSENTMADIRKSLYQKLISLPIVFYEKNRVGDLLSRLTSDVTQLNQLISITLAEFLRQILILLVGISYIIFQYKTLAIYMLATFPIIIVGAMIFGRYIKRRSKKRQDELANTNVVVEETLTNISVVKSFTNERFENNRYGTAMARLVKEGISLGNVRAIFGSFIIVVLFGGIFFILWKGAMLVQSGEMLIGGLVAFIAYTMFIGGAIGSLGNFYSQIVSAIGGTERIMEILDMESEVPMGHLGTDSIPNMKGNIQFNNVHFSYPTRDDIPVLKGIDLDVSAGQKIALVGSSGAGKSTIAQLILRFYSLESGNILVDGKDIFDYDIHDYRNHVGVVPQEVLLFGGTIRENIEYGKPGATEEEIIRAAKQSNSLEFIEGFPDGLETIVGERGIKLSGGQRQRIAIARAILRNPTILILDEATSSLDSESEKVVQDALNNLMQGRTSIIIAHRLSTIREVDCIYVLDDGKIIEKGTHDELSVLENGAYNAFAKLQFENS